MENLKRKLWFIFVPFLIVAAGYVIGYTLLNWLLIIHLKVLSTRIIVIDLWIPAATCWIAVYIWMWPRIKMLAFNTLKNKLMLTHKKNDSGFGITMIMTLAIIAFTGFTQGYMRDATGKMTTLENIEQINTQPLTRYYTLKKFYFDKHNASYSITYNTSGKGHQTFHIHLFYTLPIFEKEIDTAKNEATAWLAVYYNDSFNNDLSQPEKDKRCKAFEQQTRERFRTESFDGFSYLQLRDDDENTGDYTAALKFSNKFHGKSNLLLKSCYGAFEDRTVKDFIWMIASFSIGALMVFLFLLKPQLSEAAIAKFENEQSNKNKVY